MMGVFAEFERAMIRERVLAGLARAKEQGITLGRPQLEDSDPDKVTAIKAALAASGDCGASLASSGSACARCIGYGKSGHNFKAMPQQLILTSGKRQIVPR